MLLGGIHVWVSPPSSAVAEMRRLAGRPCDADSGGQNHASLPVLHAYIRPPHSATALANRHAHAAGWATTAARHEGHIGGRGPTRSVAVLAPPAHRRAAAVVWSCSQQIARAHGHDGTSMLGWQLQAWPAHH